MKVKTLLESLVKINKNDAIVCLHHPEGDRVTFVCGYEKNVWLESEKEDPGEYKMCTDRSTVGWLIYTLGFVDPNSHIHLHTEDGEEALFVVSFISPQKYSNIICLEAESDNDMCFELENRFGNALEDYEDELEFYSDLLDKGITVEMVEKYLGKSQAEHMKIFCEEHGLI